MSHMSSVATTPVTMGGADRAVQQAWVDGADSSHSSTVVIV
jgi:hypothetical protein